ncbi:hypothetical protein QYE76_068738 [Lolium multiflorum]|uniref:RNase H type-1 domain-containing protein n=1 Tax=Lolium multiflorum TaxID=4521 RepID=A0AAD8SG23_LOLMU|nr:hypothetical protein QYE76_068738 [Lolium multiflorum]
MAALAPYFAQPWCGTPSPFHVLPPPTYESHPTPPRSSSPSLTPEPSSSSLSPAARPFQPRIMVQWQPPPDGFVKLNFDGSLYNDGSGRASIGGVIRDCRGRVLIAFAERTEHTTVGIVEAQALIRGLRLARYYFLGGLGMVAEGDDRVLVRLLRAEDTYTRIPLDMQQEIITLLGQFPACQVQHIFREGNQVADALCHAAYQQQGVWVGAVALPGAVVEKVEDDAYGVKHERICKPKPPRCDSSIQSLVS